MFWVVICLMYLTVCSCPVTYVFQSESTLYSWPYGWVFVHELSGSGFESSCSHISNKHCPDCLPVNFSHTRWCFEPSFPWISCWRLTFLMYLIVIMILVTEVFFTAFAVDDHLCFIITRSVDWRFIMATTYKEVMDIVFTLKKIYQIQDTEVKKRL